MDDNVSAILLSYTLYALYVLLPMIPSIVIYRLFPDTKVALNGPLANITLKSTGAFAAYIVTVFIGFFIIRDTLTMIIGMTQPIWTIKARLEIQNSNGEKLSNPDQSILRALKITVNPDINVNDGEHVRLKVPSTGSNLPDYIIKFDITNFGAETIDTSQLNTSDINIDKNKRTLTITRPITIKKITLPNSTYNSSEYLNPIQGGPQ